ncbi:MAG: hypothetical protein Ta2F_08760 [Termitinemataceae bacterium]|nr:MAG: hypothetical protein Ta2F_08760 [Termitinemataceae bacterium]
MKKLLKKLLSICFAMSVLSISACTKPNLPAGLTYTVTGWYKFYIKDNTEGSHTIFVDDLCKGAPNSFDIDVKKVKGDALQPYGITLYSKTGSLDSYKILITVNGELTIFKYIAGNTEVDLIKDGEKSDAVISGYNKTNNIKITKDNFNYVFFINGQEVYSVTDNRIDADNINFTAFTETPRKNINIEDQNIIDSGPIDFRFRIN